MRNLRREARDCPEAQKIAWLLAALMLVGLAHQAVMQLCSFHGYHVVAANADSREYGWSAMIWAHGGTFHSQIRTPGYPALLALVYAVTGNRNPFSFRNIADVVAVQAILLVLVGVPLFFAVRRLTASCRIAFIATLLWVVNNSAQYSAKLLLTEALTASLMCLLVYALARSFGDRSARWYAAVGAVMFLMTLTRPSCSLLCIPVTAGILLHIMTTSRRRVQHAAVALGLLLVFPLSAKTLWAWRNQVVEGQRYYCRLSAFGVYELDFAAALDYADGRTPDLGRYTDEFFALLPRLIPQQMDRMYYQRTLRILRHHPLAVGRFWLRNSLRLLLPRSPDAGYHRALSPKFWRSGPLLPRLFYAYELLGSVCDFVIVWLLLLLLLYGIHLLSRHAWRDMPEQRGFFVTGLLMMGYWFAVHSDASSEWRYFLPIVPECIALASVVVSVSIHRLRSGRRTAESAGPIAQRAEPP